jgi:hypothetical protein
MDTWYKSSALDQWLNPKASGSSKDNIIQDLGEENWRKWREGKLSGDDLLNFIQDNRAELSPSFYSTVMAGLIAGNDGGFTDANNQFARLKSALDALKPDSNSSTAEKTEWNSFTMDLETSARNIRNSGVTGEELRMRVDSIIEFANSEVLRKAVIRGGIGTRGIGGGDADKTLKALVYHGNKGTLDDVFTGRLTPGGRERFTAGGERTAVIFSQANEEGKKVLADMLKKGGISLAPGPGEIAGDSSGDLDGYIRYRGTDGDWYRLGIGSENGAFHVERLVDGVWEPYTEELRKRTKEAADEKAKEARERAIIKAIESGMIR